MNKANQPGKFQPRCTILYMSCLPIRYKFVPVEAYLKFALLALQAVLLLVAYLADLVMDRSFGFNALFC